MEEEHHYPKMQGSTKGLLVVVAVIAIVIPILLGAALVEGLPYSTPTQTAAQTSTSSGSNVVYLPQGAGGAQKLNFSPSTLSVAAGAVVMFVDQDNSAPHNVYFTSVPGGATNPNPANVPILKQGDTYNVTLTMAGTYTYECQFHSGWMQGTITVTG